MSTRDIP
jgi:hypothetical protein